MPDKSNMSLTVNVAITGTIGADGGSQIGAQYSQGATNPPSANVVDGSGDIYLANMNWDNNTYNKNTDITFNLSGTISNDYGGSIPFGFPGNVAQAITITKQGGGGNSQLTPSLGNGTQQLLIADLDDDGADYTYCMNLLAQTGGNGTTVALDPNIVNR